MYVCMYVCMYACVSGGNRGGGGDRLGVIISFFLLQGRV